MAASGSIMLRGIIRYGLLSVATVAVVAVAVVLALRPPVPLKVPERGVVLAKVTLINPGIDRRPGVTITVEGSKIGSIADNTHGPSADRRFEGAYVLPGLIDMHVHHPPAGLSATFRYFELMYLVHGVTTVRDVGDPAGTILESRDRIRHGEFPGLRIFACGPFIDGDPPVAPGARVVHDAAEAERVVDEVASAGADCIKVYTNLTEDALAGVRKAAARHGLPLVGHVPQLVPFERAHLDDVQHLFGVSGRADPAVIEAAAPSGDYIRIGASAWENTDEARIDFIVRTSVEQKIAHTPTIVVRKAQAMLGDYDRMLDDPRARMMPAYFPKVFWRAQFPRDSYAAWGEQLPKVMSVVRRLHEAGVPIHVGTDTPDALIVPGASLHEELHNLVEAGFTVEEAWAAATWGNGDFVSHDGLGRVQSGVPADLLIFRRDPTGNLDALSSLMAVMADGRLYEKSALDSAVTDYRDYFRSWLFDRVSTAIVRLFSSPGVDARARVKKIAETQSRPTR